jgi:hypothetical protein
MLALSWNAADLHSLDTANTIAQGTKLLSRSKMNLEPTDNPPLAGIVSTTCGAREPAIEKSNETIQTIASKSTRVRQSHFAASFPKSILFRVRSLYLYCHVTAEMPVPGCSRVVLVYEL